MQALIHLVNLVENPNFDMISSRKKVIYLIKSISHIELYSHTLLLVFHAGMYCFLDNNDVVKDLMPNKKSSLCI